jgi:hypothetical protein
MIIFFYICIWIVGGNCPMKVETRTPFPDTSVRENLKTGNMKPKRIKTCSICELKSQNKVWFHGKYGDYLCNKHKRQFDVYEHILEFTKFDSNPIIIKENYAEIIIFNNKHQEKGRALIDIDDVDLVKNYKWCIGVSGYVINRKIGSLHRLVLKNQSREIKPDHINRNKLDCRKFNLRMITHALNIQNSKIWKHNTSGTTGVSWCEARNKWLALIQISGKLIRLGAFYNIQDAINTRKKAEVELLPIEIYPR